MKILVLNPILFSGVGNTLPKVDTIKDTMIYSMCLGFKKLGYDVTLVAMEDYRPQKEDKWDFEIIFVKGNFDRYLHKALPFSFEIWRILKKRGSEFDMILSSEVFAFHSLFASLVCPAKTLIWHELALHQHKLHQLPSKIWYNIVARMFMKKSLVIGRSVYARDFVLPYHGFTTEECVEHGINVERFKGVQVKNDSFVVISQLIERKNIPSIIRNFKKLIDRESYVNYKLYIIGRGKLEQELKNLVIELGCSENVVFTGFMTHECMSIYVGKAKAMLIDTKQDNNMVSIPEAIACGTPVVTNTIPTNSYLIAQNGLGIVKDGWTDDDLIEIILHSGVYSQNCMNYRKKLSCEYAAKSLVELFKKYHERNN